jgi:hypothetical protein
VYKTYRCTLRDGRLIVNPAQADRWALIFFFFTVVRIGSYERWPAVNRSYLSGNDCRAKLYFDAPPERRVQNEPRVARRDFLRSITVTCTRRNIVTILVIYAGIYSRRHLTSEVDDQGSLLRMADVHHRQLARKKIGFALVTVHGTTPYVRVRFSEIVWTATNTFRRGFTRLLVRGRTHTSASSADGVFLLCVRFRFDIVPLVRRSAYGP